MNVNERLRMELDTRIETKHKRRHVNVDLYDGYVWLGLVTEAARCHVTLTKDQAKDMIAALIRIVDAEVKP
jgi:hypothetical protein